MAPASVCRFTNQSEMNQNKSNTDGNTGFDMRTVQLMCFPLIILVGLAGNALICVAVRRRSRLRVHDCFILNLATTDLATCLISIPFDFVEVLIGKWPFGMYLCKTVYPLQTILISVSVYTLLCMSLERRRAIIRPFMPKVKRCLVIGGICVVWVFSISLMGPYVAILDVKYSNDSRACIENWTVKSHAKIFTLAVFIVLFLLPLFAITTNYVAISSKLWKDIQRIKKAIGKSPNQGKKQLIKARAQRNMRIVKIFVLAVIVFAVCMIPNHIMWIWHDFGSGEEYEHFGTILVFCNILIYANSAINPFIFMSLHSQYCKDIFNLLPCCNCQQCKLSVCIGPEAARKKIQNYKRKRRFSQARRKALRGKRNRANKLAFLRGSPWDQRYYESDSSEIYNYNIQPAKLDHRAEVCREDTNDGNIDNEICWIPKTRRTRVNFGGERIFHIEKFDQVQTDSPI